MKIVVTGGRGHLGQWVVRELVDDSDGKTVHDVTVFDTVVPRGDEPHVHFMAGDVEDLGQVIGAVAGADAVIHLAAVRRWGVAANEVVFRVNTMGCFNVHEAAWRMAVRRVVSTSSESVLGWDYRVRDFDPEYLPIDEAHPVLPQDAYGLSKEVGEAIARSYTRKCDMETVVLRPPWVLTPEEMETLRQARGRRPNTFIAAGYVDVRDLAVAYRLAAERSLRGHHVLYTVADDASTAEPLNVVLPRLLPSIGDMASHLTGDQPALSNARAKEVLGWAPRRSWRRPDPG